MGVQNRLAYRYIRLLPYVRRQWPALSIILLLALIAAPVAALMPWPLKILVDYGLVERVSYNTIPPKVEYSLSNEGHEFREAILPLLRWAAGKDDGIQEPCVPGCKRHVVL